MKKVLFGTMLLVLLTGIRVPAMAQVDISINIGLPPPIVYPEPPVVIVLPDTYYVYAVPDIEIDLFFWNGWWWRPWHGRWYRSRYYDRGWVYYQSVPRFYYDVDPRWRVYYRNHDWRGHHWYYERIDDRRLERNWQGWQNNKHWERQQTWGVQGYRPPPPQKRQEVRVEREREYQQRPEVREHQQQREQQQRQPQYQKPQGPSQRQPQGPPPRQQPEERVQQPQRQEQGPPGEKPQHGKPQGKPQGKPEGAGGGHKKQDDKKQDDKK
jgi:hypothetical protein